MVFQFLELSNIGITVGCNKYFIQASCTSSWVVMYRLQSKVGINSISVGVISGTDRWLFGGGGGAVHCSVEGVSCSVKGGWGGGCSLFSGGGYSLFSGGAGRRITRAYIHTSEEFTCRMNFVQLWK